MYLRFYGLTEKPFSQTPDPKFLYWNNSYREALASLRYGIEERKGFLTMIGEAGTGKTTMLRKLLDDLGPEVVSVFLFNPNAGFDEILEYTLSELGIAVPSGRKLAMLQRLNEFLLAAFAEGKNTILLIDEAQDLDAEVLESLRLLSNLETSKEKILQIVLSGQPELAVRLANDNLRQLKQRISVRCRLEPLRRPELPEYIRARLRIAGGREDLFGDDCLADIWAFAGGIPRLVNTVCDNALLVGYAVGKERIDQAVVAEVVADLARLDVLAEPRASGRLAAQGRDGEGAGGGDAALGERNPTTRRQSAPGRLPAAAAVSSPPSGVGEAPPLAASAAPALATLPPKMPEPPPGGQMRSSRSAPLPHVAGLAVLAAAFLLVGVWIGSIKQPTSRAPNVEAGAVEQPPRNAPHLIAAGDARRLEDGGRGARSAAAEHPIEPSTARGTARDETSASAPRIGVPDEVRAVLAAARPERDPRGADAPAAGTGAAAAAQNAPSGSTTTPGAQRAPDRGVRSPDRDPSSGAPRIIASSRVEQPSPGLNQSPRSVGDRGPAAGAIEPRPRPEGWTSSRAPAGGDRDFSTAQGSVPAGAVGTPSQGSPIQEVQDALQRTLPQDGRLVVRPGDTLLELAARTYGSANYTTLDMLTAANPGLEDIDKIRAGRTIVFPDPGPQSRVIAQDGSIFVLAFTTPDQDRAQGVRRKLQGEFGSRVEIEPVALGGSKRLYRVSLRDLHGEREAGELARALGSILDDPGERPGS